MRRVLNNLFNNEEDDIPENRKTNEAKSFAKFVFVIGIAIFFVVLFVSGLCFNEELVCDSEKCTHTVNYILKSKSVTVFEPEYLDNIRVQRTHRRRTRHYYIYNWEKQYSIFDTRYITREGAQNNLDMMLEYRQNPTNLRIVKYNTDDLHFYLLFLIIGVYGYQDSIVRFFVKRTKTNELKKAKRNTMKIQGFNSRK